MKVRVRFIETSSWSLAEDGSNFVCDHEFTHNEVVEVDTTRNGEHDTYETKVVVCDDCDETLDDVEPDWEEVDGEGYED